MMRVIATALLVALVGCSAGDDPEQAVEDTTTTVEDTTTTSGAIGRSEPEIESRVTVSIGCGIHPLEHDGRTWRSTDFDERNVRAGFVGSGAVGYRSDDELVYLDDSGIQVVFVPETVLNNGGCA